MKDELGEHGELGYYHAYLRLKERLVDLIRVNRYVSVCDIGGGRSPLFSLEDVRQLGLAYTILDVSQEELDQAPAGYRKIRSDICDAGLGHIPERFDLIFSRMVAEHVPDGVAMHRNVLTLLNPGGIAFHMFPTLFNPVFLANKLLPRKAAERVVYLVRPWARRVPKFPAPYSKCYGPTRRMQRFFKDLGYEVEQYRPFYGTDYLEGLPILGTVDSIFTRFVARRRSPHFTSYVWVTLRKPPS